MKRVGLIGRCDNCGLGNMSWSFHDNLPITKTLLYKRSYACFPDRFKNHKLVEYASKSDVNWLLADIDTLIAIETPYEWEMFAEAKKRGIKTIMLPMPEFFPDKRHWHLVDLWWCISPLEYAIAPKNKVLIRNPVDKKKIKFRLREEANVFVANAGHGGMCGRNGISELIKAISHIRRDFKLILRSQFPMECNDPRVDLRIGNLKNYSDLWNEGDMYIHLCKFGGDHMPINEAMAAGLPVIALDHHPWNKFIPKETLVPIIGTTSIDFSGVNGEMAIVKPEDIAFKIATFIGDDIRVLSYKSDTISDTFSWETLRPKILEIL